MRSTRGLGLLIGTLLLVSVAPLCAAEPAKPPTPLSADPGVASAKIGRAHV